MIESFLELPPFTVRVRSPMAAVASHLTRFYGPLVRRGGRRFVDFDVQVLPGRGVRRWWRPQARFLLDGQQPFLPLPGDQAAPVLEWGLNWCIASRPLGYAVIHAAVVAWDDEAVVMPGHPGAGKSTLCSSLVFCGGGRLLSDELAIVDGVQGRLLPHPRAIALKNESIDIVSAFPGATLGPRYLDTRKGTLSHAACPEASLQSAHRPARARWIVFPRFEAGAELDIEEIPRAEAFALIAEQSFNKESMGLRGFEAVCGLLSGATCHMITYGSTAQGLEALRRIRHA